MFCTAINCMDGRVQLPVIEYLRRRFNVPYVDVITEPGPNRILAPQEVTAAAASILSRVRISVEKHSSVGLAVVAHHDCAGNPAPREQQIRDLQRAGEFLKANFDALSIIGLWLDDKWQVEEICSY